MNGKSRRDIALKIIKHSERIICLILLADAIGVATASVVLEQNLFRDFTGITSIELND